MNKKHLIRAFLLFTSVFALISGIIGNLSGIIIAKFIGQSLFPLLDFSLRSIILQMQGKFLLNATVYGIICGLIVSLFMRKQLSRLVAEEPRSLISERSSKNIGQKNQKIKMKFDLLFFCIGILLILYMCLISVKKYTYITYDLKDFDFYQGYSDMGFLLSFPFLIIFPFFFPSVLIRVPFEYIPSSFRKVRSKWKKLLPNPIRNIPIKKKMLIWGLKNDWSKFKISLRNLTLSLIIITLFMSLNQSYVYTKSVYDSILSANGELVDVYLDEPESLTLLSNTTEQLKHNLENMEIEHINAMYYTEYADHNYDFDNSGISLTHQSLSTTGFIQSGYRFCSTNYSLWLQEATLRDEWFIGGSAKEIISRLYQEDDAVIIPSYMLEGDNTIGGDLHFRYRTLNGTIEQKKGTIVGAFEMLPSLIQSRYDVIGNPEAYIFMNPHLLTHAVIPFIEYTLYNPRPITMHQYSQMKSLCMSSIDGVFNFYIVNLYDDYSPFDNYLFQFLKGEIVIIVLLILLGIGTNIYSSYKKVDPQIGLLRAKGYQKKDLFLLNWKENGIFLIIALLLSTLSILGVNMYVLILNVIRDSDAFPIYTLFSFKSYIFSIIIGGIIFIGAHLVTSLWNLNQTDSKKNLEKILRYRY
jgi:predicted nucleic acid-binding Zn ribbon protein